MNSSAAIIRSKIVRSVKWYSRPSVSDPLGARVVYEMENYSPSTSVRTCATSGELPEPEGAEMINSIPAMLTSSVNGVQQGC